MAGTMDATAYLYAAPVSSRVSVMLITGGGTGGTGTQVESEIATWRAEFALKRYRVDRTKKKISRRVKDGEVPKNTQRCIQAICADIRDSRQQEW